MANKDIWNKVKRPPETALKPITGGRLKGMTDIKPQWRLEVMTELFGPCGVGWKYEIVNLWPIHIENGEATAFAQINLYFKENDKWSDPIPGIGGSMLVANESKGPHVSDEAYKMALTDALSVAMKALGVGAEIYYGNYDGSKYLTQPDRIQIPRDVAQKVMEQSLAAIEKGDGYALKEIWMEFDTEEKSVLWGKFNSQQRSIMKELMKDVS